MTPRCDSPIADRTLVDYWSRDMSEGDDIDRVEEHLFTCAECTGRLERLANISAGLAALARQGQVSGIVTRALVNRMQREGLRVRMFSLAPGETVPCAVFPMTTSLSRHSRRTCRTRGP
jgi:hypothetical protein